MGTSEDWDAEAATFDEAADHGLLEPACREAWRRLLRTALPAAPARVADLGSGTGTLAQLLAEEGHEVVGVDFSPAMVALARAKAPAVTFVVGDAAAPPLPPGSYDVVLSRHVLWAMPDPADALGRWVDLLAPGGRLVLVEGSWHTGAGLTAAEAEAIVRTRRTDAEVRLLDDPVLWGAPLRDERYLLVSLR
jgi:SAM-dependent methyltransferase